MLVESWTIIFLVLMFYGVFSMHSRNKLAIAVLPLVCVPLANIVSGPLSRYLFRSFGWDKGVIDTVWIVLALVVSCLLFGSFASRFKRRSANLPYLFSASLFTFVFALVVLFQ